MRDFVVPTIVVGVVDAVGSPHTIRDALKEGSVAVCQVRSDLPAFPVITPRSLLIMSVERSPQI